jgi:hypothetical protein
MIKTIPQRICPECESDRVCHTGKMLSGAVQSTKLGPAYPDRRTRRGIGDWIGPVHSNCYSCDHEWEDVGPPADNIFSWRCLHIYAPDWGEQAHIGLVSARDLLREDTQLGRSIIERVRSGKVAKISGFFYTYLYLPVDKLIWEGL